MNRNALLCGVAVAATAGSGSAQTLLFDLGRIDKQSDPTIFNNLTTATQSIGNTIDVNGNGTGIAVSITNPFFLTGEPSELGTESPSGAAAQFGVDATDDYFFGHTGAFAGEESNPLSVIEFQNLDQNALYTFTIFASRGTVTDTREAVYEAAGAEITSAALNASNNDSDVAVLADLAPDQNGVISISTFAGPNNDNANSFYYLGAIRLDVVPAPGGAGVLGLGLAAFGRRRR